MALNTPIPNWNPEEVTKFMSMTLKDLLQLKTESAMTINYTIRIAGATIREFNAQGIVSTEEELLIPKGASTLDLGVDVDIPQGVVLMLSYEQGLLPKTVFASSLLLSSSSKGIESACSLSFDIINLGEAYSIPAKVGIMHINAVHSFKAEYKC
jgi:hypothetical protein